MWPPEVGVALPGFFKPYMYHQSLSLRLQHWVLGWKMFELRPVRCWWLSCFWLVFRLNTFFKNSTFTNAFVFIVGTIILSTLCKGYDVSRWKNVLKKLGQTKAFFTTNAQPPYCSKYCINKEGVEGDGGRHAWNLDLTVCVCYMCFQERATRWRWWYGTLMFTGDTWPSNFTTMEQKRWPTSTSEALLFYSYQVSSSLF